MIALPPEARSEEQRIFSEVAVTDEPLRFVSEAKRAAAKGDAKLLSPPVSVATSEIRESPMTEPEQLPERDAGRRPFQLVSLVQRRRGRSDSALVASTSLAA